MYEEIYGNSFSQVVVGYDRYVQEAKKNGEAPVSMFKYILGRY